MRNPLTRDRLNAAFPGRPDIVRAFEEIAQFTDDAPDEIEQIQTELGIVMNSAATARSGLARLADSVDALAAVVAAGRAPDETSWHQRIEALEALLHAAK